MQVRILFQSDFVHLQIINMYTYILIYNKHIKCLLFHIQDFLIAVAIKYYHRTIFVFECPNLS